MVKDKELTKMELLVNEQRRAASTIMCVCVCEKLETVWRGSKKKKKNAETMGNQIYNVNIQLINSY